MAQYTDDTKISTFVGTLTSDLQASVFKDGNNSVYAALSKALSGFTATKDNTYIDDGSADAKITTIGKDVTTLLIGGTNTGVSSSASVQISATAAGVTTAYLGSHATGLNTLNLTAADKDITVVLDGTTEMKVTANATKAGLTDNITLVEAKDSVVEAKGAGNAEITVQAGSGNTITTGAGTDTVTLNNTSNNTVTTGEGGDTVTVNGGYGNTVAVGNGKDTVTLSATSDTTVTAGNGNNTIKVVDGQRSHVTITNTQTPDPTNNDSNAPEYDNTKFDTNKIIVAGENGASNSDVTVVGRFVNDNVSIENASNTSYTHSDQTYGKDSVAFNNTTSSTMTIGGGNNTVYLRGAKDSEVTLGDGNDTVTITSLEVSSSTKQSTGTTLDAGDGDNTITIEGAATGTKITSGAGKDTFNINADALKGAEITINAGDGDDTVVITMASGATALTASDFTYNEDAGTWAVKSNSKIVLTDVENVVIKDSDGKELSNFTLPEDGSTPYQADVEITKTTSYDYSKDNPNGDYHVTVNNADSSNLTFGDGDNTIGVNSSDKVTLKMGDGTNTVTLTRSEDATITVGDGDNTLKLTRSDGAEITAGSGDNTVELTSSDDVTYTATDGDNTVSLTQSKKAEVSLGNGDNDVTLTNSDDNTITTGTGDNEFTLKASEGNTITAGNIESLTLDKDTADTTIVVNGNGDGNVKINAATGTSYTATGTGDHAIAINGAATGTTITTGAGETTIKLDAKALSSAEVTVDAGDGYDVVELTLKANSTEPTFSYNDATNAWVLDSNNKISLTNVEEVQITDSKGNVKHVTLPADGSAPDTYEEEINKTDDATGDYSSDGNHDVDVTKSDNANLTFGNGNNTLNLTQSDNAVVTMGNGDNVVTLHSVQTGSTTDGVNGATITAGSGDNVFTLYNSDKATITVTGDGDNTFTLAATEVRDGQTISGAGATNSTLTVEGDGDNVFDVTGGSVNAIKVDGKGHNTATITKSSEATVEFTGKGNNEVTLTRSDSATVTVGDGANKLTLERSNDATLTLGNGANVVMLDRSDDVAATFGDGDNALTMSHVNGTGDDATEITFGDGANTVDVIGVTNYALTLGNGGNTVNLTNGDDGTVTDGVTVTTGEGADSIFVDDAVSNSTLNVGAGDDKIVLSDDALSGATKLTIDGGDGNDVLQIFTDTNFTRLSTGHVQVQGNTNIDLENINAILTTDADGKNGTMKIVLSSDEDTAAAQTTVAKLYALTLGRTALDADTNAVNNIDGFNYWVDRVSAQEDSQAHLVASFVDSAEFRANHSGMTSAELVQSIYNSSEATLDEETLDNFVARLDAEDITDAGKVEVLTEAVQNALTSNIQLAGVQMDQYLLGSDAGTTSEPEEEILPTNDTTPEDTVA